MHQPVRYSNTETALEFFQAVTHTATNCLAHSNTLKFHIYMFAVSHPSALPTTTCLIHSPVGQIPLTQSGIGYKSGVPRTGSLPSKSAMCHCCLFSLPAYGDCKVL